MVYLEERAKNAKNSTKPTKPVSASWLAILFAVLAVGSQYHDSPYHIRTRDSQRYIQISFHFLRVGNFLLRPNLDSIQAMLMTGFVLLNDMKAEASWALLGLTTRLAQSLGLDRHQPYDGRESPDFRKKDHLRRTLWCVSLQNRLYGGKRILTYMHAGGPLFGTTALLPSLLIGMFAVFAEKGLEE